MPSRRPRLLSAAAAVLALPFTMAASGRCGLMQDFTETYLYPEKIDRIVLVTGDGNIDAVAYEREGVFIRRHSFGFLRSFVDPVSNLEGTTLSLQVDCEIEGNCQYDHMMELPFGIEMDITMSHALMDVGYFDSPLTLTFETGYFYGVRLAIPELTITADDIEVDAEFAVAPEAVTIELTAGDVVLELPAGAYQCNLDAGPGEVTLDGITCDEAATSVLDVQIRKGTITVTGVAP
ncbi:hypothetical protein [Nannocystis radixulma]|uniref:Adhesin domain-containing protein n=1 Tax=Nannocystis radixulma TaxID=2995305 RepID=A0ABT5B5I7_9BACT|nr:hypothetical protein [Nannocystis radixulma]MDC0669395.1 hypothetical protein [Nannocystis radixulma]